jgi:hypothetical protein
MAGARPNRVIIVLTPVLSEVDRVGSALPRGLAGADAVESRASSCARCGLGGSSS